MKGGKLFYYSPIVPSRRRVRLRQRSSCLLQQGVFHDKVVAMTSLFTSSSQSRDHGEAAATQVKAFEKTLALRIGLQKVLDVGNRLPLREASPEKINTVYDGIEESEEFQESSATCGRALRSLTSLLAKERAEGKGENVTSGEVEISENPTWEEIFSMQQELRPNWENVVNKLHARLNFGSDTAQSKMRVFNQKIWDQIASIRNDEKRIIEKSRMPKNDSQRLGRETHSLVPSDQRPQEESDDDDDGNSDSGDDDDENDSDDIDRKNNKKRKGAFDDYDMEVYDDRPFYSMLLKTFITNSSNGEGVSNIRASDLSALKKYKRSKSVVDRRASKGRKIRYVSHKKLENFMFPQHVAESSISSERLYKSLFQ